MFEDDSRKSNYCDSLKGECDQKHNNSEAFLTISNYVKKIC